MSSSSSSTAASTSYKGPQSHHMAFTTVFLQDACLQHRFIRSRDTSTIVERPERLRAVKIGLAAAIARLEEVYPAAAHSAAVKTEETDADADALADAIGRMNLVQSDTTEEIPLEGAAPLRVIRSSAKVDLIHDPAVKFIHGDVDGDVYLEKLCRLVRESGEKVADGQSEIPEGWSQGDLYLSPTSLDAMQGAIGTVCEAVDAVVGAAGPSKPPPAPHAFVAIRPPGHHCGEDTPSGFCFLNNVAIAAAHAHLKHGVNRVVIFDIDLHHGNGTQSIAWQINEDAYREKLERESGAPVSDKKSLQIYYGSVHDVLSYPCEDGKQELVQAASVSIHGPHGQYIENVHLEPYESEEQFWEKLYNGAYNRLLNKAENFLRSTGEGEDDTMVFISCGFDASEHEYSSMSRHARKVPTSFFHRFTRDACAFADKWARGRVVSVLEGGYSDKALLSGSMAHLTGLVGGADSPLDRGSWWTPDIVDMLAKLAKKRRGPKTSLSASDAHPPAWLERATALLAKLDPAVASSTRTAFVPPSTRTLRARKPASPPPNSNAPVQALPLDAKAPTSTGSEETESSLSELSDEEPPAIAPQKKLPRVILKIGPAPSTRT
ncbi:Arginase/deacetylase [Amylostereum chailletii]|nr:Arginase/deacetylase [Amylostereum chailletii]